MDETRGILARMMIMDEINKVNGYFNGYRFSSIGNYLDDDLGRTEGD